MARSRRRFIASLGTLAATGWALSPGRRASGADSYTLRYSSTGQSNVAWNVMATKWAAAVNRRSNGRLKIEVYPNSQLAKEAESISGLTTGVVDIALEAGVFLETLFPQMQVFTLPFMFKNYAAAYRVVDGPIGDEFFAQFENKGIVGLAWGATGFREMSSVGTRVVRVPEDMKGLRFRVQGGAVAIAMSQALGLIPVTIDVTEVYTALVQHTIDVVDQTPTGVITTNESAVVTHIALTNHVFNLQPLVASKSKIDALPADLQKILKEEAKAALPSWRSAITRENADALTTMKNKGIAINDTDYNAFRKAMDPVYATFQTKLGGDLVQRVSRAANAT